MKCLLNPISLRWPLICAGIISGIMLRVIEFESKSSSITVVKHITPGIATTTKKYPNVRKAISNIKFSFDPLKPCGMSEDRESHSDQMTEILSKTNLFFLVKYSEIFIL